MFACYSQKILLLGDLRSEIKISDKVSQQVFQFQFISISVPHFLKPQ